MTSTHFGSQIVIRFKGGLANQIYQLAAGIFIANALGQTCFFSDVYFANCRNTRMLIAPSIFDLDIIQIKESKLRALPYWLMRRLPNFLKEIFLLATKQSVIDDHNYKSFVAGLSGIDQQNANISRRIVLDGYFHNQTLLIQSGVLQNLSILEAPSKEAIAIHVRLGDYLKHPYSKFYRLINAGYIRQAFKLLLLNGATSDLPVHVFSDSPLLAQKLVCEALPDLSFSMKYGNSSALADLRDLSSHRYLILSNSSFSLLSWHLSHDSFGVIPKNWFQSMPTDPDQFPESNRLVRLDIPNELC
jgi:hypothetical protein